MSRGDRTPVRPQGFDALETRYLPLRATGSWQHRADLTSQFETVRGQIDGDGAIPGSQGSGAYQIRRGEDGAIDCGQ